MALTLLIWLSFKVIRVEYWNNNNFIGKDTTNHQVQRLSKFISLALRTKSRNKPCRTILKCINTKYEDNKGTYIEGTNSDIFISRTEMVYSVEDLQHLPKYINTHESRLEIRRSSFISEIYFNQEKKINIVDPIGQIIVKDTKFEDLTYKFNSSSGIIITNQYHTVNFSVCFINCCVINKIDENVSKGNNGGFYYQDESNNELIIDNCYFEGCLAYEYGGCLYLRSCANTKGCTINNCHSGKGSAIYLDKNSKNMNLLGCTIQNIREGNSIIYIKLNNENILEIKDFIFQSILKQEEKILGIRINEVGEIIFKNCTIIAENFDSSLISSKDIKINLKSVKFNIENNLNIPLMNIKTEFICENIEYSKNNTFGTFSDDPFTMKNCKFHNIGFTGDLIVISGKKVIIEDSIFNDIEMDSKLNGGLGLNTTPCLEINLTNCNFENVGTKLYSGGIIILQDTLESFNCINCKCVRCYALGNTCCFLLNDHSGIESRKIISNFKDCYFEECYLKYMRTSSLRQICSIFFSSFSINSYIEVRYCTFVNPGLTMGEDNRQGAALINCPYFSFEDNIFLNSLNQLTSITSTLKEDQTIGIAYVFRNHTYINVSSFSSLLYFSNVGDFVLENCYFQDVSIKEGHGIGIVLNMKNLKVTFSNCTFVNCRNGKNTAIFYSSQEGQGAILNFLMKNCNISTTHSAKNGAFRLARTKATIINTKFKLCSTESSGGCILCEALAFLNISNCSFDNCVAHKNGGAIYIDQSTANYYLSDLTGNGNKAGESGGFIFFDNTIDSIDLDFFEGENNYAPGGEVAIYRGPFSGVTINSISNKFVGIFNIQSVNLHGGSGSFITDAVNNLLIDDFKLNHCNISCDTIQMNDIKMVDGEMEIRASDYIKISKAEFINSPNIALSSISIDIKNSYFSYKKTIFSETQIKILKLGTVIAIRNTTFLTNSNRFGIGDHISSNVKVNLTIDGNCCFNQERMKSIRIPIGSFFEAPDSVFNCKLAPTNTENLAATKKHFEFDLIGFMIIILSIIFLIIVVIVYCIFSTRKLLELSDSFDGGKLESIQVIVDGTEINSSNTNDNQVNIYAFEITDISDDDILSQESKE